MMPWRLLAGLQQLAPRAPKKRGRPGWRLASAVTVGDYFDAFPSLDSDFAQDDLYPFGSARAYGMLFSFVVPRDVVRGIEVAGCV